MIRLKGNQPHKPSGIFALCQPGRVSMGRFSRLTPGYHFLEYANRPLLECPMGKLLSQLTL